MKKTSIGRRLLNAVMWLFLASGIFNLLGVLFSADGASIGVGLFNSVVGYLFLRPSINEFLNSRKSKS